MNFQDTIQDYPNVLLEYEEATKEEEQDIFVLLRPHTNTYKIESLLLSVFRKSPEYKKTIHIRYFANLPGKFILQSKMLQHHYETKLFFARNGKKAFSNEMKILFEKRYKEDFESAKIMGAFEAMEQLHLEENTLFNMKMNSKHYYKIAGQTINKISSFKNRKPFYIINYEMPAVLLNTISTSNCAVILIRTTLNYKEFNKHVTAAFHLILKETNMRNNGVNETETCKRIFHYSKGPFEQLRDAFEFLYTIDKKKVSPKKFTFAKFLEEKGIPASTLYQLLRYPIGNFLFQNKNKNPLITKTTYDSLYELTLFMSYEEAYNILHTMHSQRLTNTP